MGNLEDQIVTTIEYDQFGGGFTLVQTGPDCPARPVLFSSANREACEGVQEFIRRLLRRGCDSYWIRCNETAGLALRARIDRLMQGVEAFGAEIERSKRW